MYAKALRFRTASPKWEEAEEPVQAAQPAQEIDDQEPQARVHLRLINHTPASTFESMAGGTMDISGIVAGATLWLEDGSVVEVLAPSPDGRTVRVRYVESPFDASLEGTQADCTDYDIISYADGGDRADSTALS